MKAITPEALRALNTTFHGRFKEGYDKTEPFHPRYMTAIPSGSRSNTYGWAAKRHRVREWIGERKLQGLSSHSYTIVNKKWEDTLAVDRDDFDDDNLGIYDPQVVEMGEEFRKHPDDLLIDLMQNGETTTCFDGQNFYDTDHPVDILDASKGTQANLRTSFALTQDNLLQVLADMMSFKGDDDRPLRVNPSVLSVPPALQGTARKLLESSFLLQALQNVAGTENVSAAGVDNITKGILKLDVIPELAGNDADWYVHDMRKSIKPFVLQTRRPVKFTARINMNDDNVFWQEKYVWGADARYNAGYALWFLSMKCKG